MVEGTFKCNIHDYGTDSPQEWRKHKAEVEHTEFGVAPCNQCGVSKEFSFTGKIGEKPPALCDDCAKKLLEGKN